MENHNTNPGQTPNEGQDHSQQSPGQDSVAGAKHSQGQYRPDDNPSPNPGSPRGNDEVDYNEADRDEESNVANVQREKPEDDDNDMEDESGNRDNRGNPASR